MDFAHLRRLQNLGWATFLQEQAIFHEVKSAKLEFFPKVRPLSVHSFIEFYAENLMYVQVFFP